MAMYQKLVLQAKLSQRLILTPSLQQAIKLLPMSTLELAEMLNQELTENPLLEEDLEAQAEEAAAAEKSDEKKEEKDEKEEKPDDDGFAEIDVESFFSDYLDEGYRPRTSFEVPELPPSRTRSPTRPHCPITWTGNCGFLPSTTSCAR